MEKFTIFKDKADEFRFNLVASNGEVVLRSSEGYTTKQGCMTGIASVKSNAPKDERYVRFNDRSGAPTFSLKAANGETIGVGESYSSTANRENGISVVKRIAPDASIEDQTV